MSIINRTSEIPIVHNGVTVNIYEDTTHGWVWDPKHINFGSSSCPGGCASPVEHIKKTIDSMAVFRKVTGTPGPYVNQLFYLSTKTVEDIRTILNSIKGPTVAVYSNGVNCKRCNMKNEYAIPNQKDNTYVCYMCR